jgi:hypothetical protein
MDIFFENQSLNMSGEKKCDVYNILGVRVMSEMKWSV